jgi:hypothetical protein
MAELISSHGITNEALTIGIAPGVKGIAALEASDVMVASTDPVSRQPLPPPLSTSPPRSDLLAPRGPLHPDQILKVCNLEPVEGR